VLAVEQLFRPIFERRTLDVGVAPLQDSERLGTDFQTILRAFVGELRAGLYRVAVFARFGAAHGLVQRIEQLNEQIRSAQPTL
jgi:hypothetical protein